LHRVALASLISQCDAVQYAIYSHGHVTKSSTSSSTRISISPLPCLSTRGHQHQRTTLLRSTRCYTTASHRQLPHFFFGATTSSLCQRDKCADVCPLSATPLQLRHSKTQRTEPKLHIGMNVCISARVTARPAVNNEHGIRLTHTRSLLTHTRSLLTHTRSLLTMQMHAHASR